MTVSAGTPFQFEANTVGGIDIARMDATNSVAIWLDNSAVDIQARVIQLDETLGTVFDVDLSPATSSFAVGVCALSSTKGIFAWKTTGGVVSLQVFTISGTTISMPGSAITLSSASGNIGDIALTEVSSTAAIVAFEDNSTGVAHYITESSNVLTNESNVQYDASEVSQQDIILLSSIKAILAYQDFGAGDGKAVILSISGVTISAGTAVQIDGTDNITATALAPISSTQSLLAYRNSTDTDGKAVVLSIIGTAITVNARIVFESGDIGAVSLAAFSVTQFVVLYDDVTNTDSRLRQLTVDGTTVTDGAASQFDASPQGVAQADAFSGSKAINVYENSGDAVILTLASNTKLWIFDGVTWSDISDPSWVEPVRGVFVKPGTAYLTIWASTGTSIYKTIDLGVSWTLKATLTFTPADIHGMADDDRIIAYNKDAAGTNRVALIDDTSITYIDSGHSTTGEGSTVRAVA